MSPAPSRLPSLLDTYSADFQKCPGWESLRFSLGSFSSMSASWVKVGLSLRSYAQQAERISWGPQTAGVSRPHMNPNKDLEISSVMFIMCHRLSVVFWVTARQLTVTSLPRLISANTFLMPSPLPTCQMVASTGWLVIGQSLAWSSYQMVLDRKKERKKEQFTFSIKRFCFVKSCHGVSSTRRAGLRSNEISTISKVRQTTEVVIKSWELWKSCSVQLWPLSWWQYKEITNVPHRQL